MPWYEIVILIVAGFAVGVINTLAGGATVISLSVLMFLGLPADVANGTHRIAALFQTFTSADTFRRQQVLDLKGGMSLALPSVLGSILGAFIAVDIDEMVFRQVAAIVMLMILILILLKPQQWIKGNEAARGRRMDLRRFLLFFVIGVYGGFIHIGIGYFLIFALVMNAGYDLLQANAVKVLIVFLYVAASLAIFIVSGLVDWKYAAVLAVGQGLGAWVSARWASRWSGEFMRWFMIIFILLSSGQLLGVYDLGKLIRYLFA
jgi:uncharacterized protein